MSESLPALRHERHYTPEEANALRDWVRERVERAREAIETLSDPVSQDALERIEQDNGGGYPGYEIARAVLGLLLAASELNSMEIILRDPERGLVDFPALRDGDEIYLCWLVNENEIGWWHESEAGFMGRQPL